MGTLTSAVAALFAFVGLACAATHTYWACVLALAGVAFIQSIRLLKIKREGS